MYLTMGSQLRNVSQSAEKRHYKCLPSVVVDLVPVAWSVDNVES